MDSGRGTETIGVLVENILNLKIMIRKNLSLAVLFTVLSCSIVFGQQSPAHFPILGGVGGMTNYTIPIINSHLFAILDGISTTNDGFGGIFIYNTNDTTTVNSTNVFAPGTGQGGRWQRLLIPGAGGSAPFGTVGGVDVTGTLPNNLTVVGINGAPLGTTTATDRNILIANGTQWRTEALSGDATIGNTGILTLTSIVGAGTGTKITFDVKGRATSITNAVLASADFNQQGVTGTFLQGNGSGAPSWTQVGLTTGVAGILPVANGGTAVATFTKGIVVSPGGTTALTTVAGTAGYFPYWSSSYPTTTSTLLTDGGEYVRAVASRFVVGNSVGVGNGGAIIQINGWNTAQKNWQLDTAALNNGLAIQASTVAGGTNFNNIGAIMYMTSDGNVSIGSDSTGTRLAVVGGGFHVGSTSDPGSNNAKIDGTLENTGLITATASLTYPSATASTATVWDGASKLISSVTTLTELSYVSGVTSSIQTQINTKTSKPIYGTGNPIALAVAGTDGQEYWNTVTGDKWTYLGGASGINNWQP